MKKLSIQKHKKLLAIFANLPLCKRGLGGFLKHKKLIISAIFLACVLIGYFTLFNKPESAVAGWWDDSWLYRSPVAITNSGTAQTDFQVLVTIDTATLITAGKMQSDCDDFYENINNQDTITKKTSIINNQ